MNRYGKQQCLDKDWNNAKEITAQEIAYCIHTYDIDIYKVPDSRLRTATKELQNLHREKAQEQEKRMIEAELAIYETTDEDPFGINCNAIGYYLDPKLFKTEDEALIAMDAFGDSIMCEENKMENGHNYKETNTHSRDIKRMKSAMDNVRRYWVKLGGDIDELNKVVSQARLQKQTTLKQDIDVGYEDIRKQFISMGVSSTRANKIAKAITKASNRWLK